MFRTVLFPIDHSRAALETAVTVLKLVQQYNSRLVLLSVVDPEDTTMANATEVGQLLQQAHDTFERAGVTPELIEREGKPAFVIGDVADEIEADLIVMGTRGISLDSDQTSTASRVIQLAPCPVLVVP
ncbi:MAG: universal stress protein [Synechococcaceae bacterium WB6_3B_236]|jgi:nucleotide-binding universal stress UspA family protein|nr:universal stress protein [Synechococcaceae bacterium WB6_3B_236]